MSEKTAKILLAAVILARSTSFVLSKIGLDSLDVFNLLGIRFLIAFAIMYFWFHTRLHNSHKSNIVSGVIIGTAYFIVMGLEVFSLKTCDSSTTAFLEHTAIVMVPLFEAVINKRLPLMKNIISMLLAITGVALMTLTGSSLSLTFGKSLAFAAAITYTAVIIITDRLTKGADALVIGIVQLGTMGALSTASSLLFENPVLPQTMELWLAILYLACVCSCFGFTLQTLAQKYTTAETASLYCAIGPLGAGFFGWFFLGEALSTYALLGAALILVSIIIAQKN